MAEADANFGAYVGAARGRLSAATATRGAAGRPSSRKAGERARAAALIIPAAARAAATARRALKVGRGGCGGRSRPFDDHGPTAPENEEDEEDWGETVLFALAAQCRSPRGGEGSRRSARRAAAPLANAVAFATVEDDDMEALCTPATPLLRSSPTPPRPRWCGRGAALQQARDDMVSYKLLDAGAVEARRAPTIRARGAARRGRQFVVRVLLLWRPSWSSRGKRRGSSWN